MDKFLTSTVERGPQLQPTQTAAQTVNILRGLNTLRLTPQFIFVNGKGYTYPTDLQTALHYMPEICDHLTQEHVAANFKFIPQINDVNSVVPVLLGEIAASLSFMDAIYVISIQPDGSVIPLHMSQMFASTTLNSSDVQKKGSPENLPAVVRAMKAATANYIVGNYAGGFAHELPGILQDGKIDKYKPLGIHLNGNSPDTLSHDIYIANGETEVQMLVQYANPAYKPTTFTLPK